MPPAPSDPAPHDSTRVQSALTGFVDEVYGTLSRLLAYVAALALIGAVGVYLWDRLPDAIATAPVPADWHVAEHSEPASDVSPPDSQCKTAAYQASGGSPPVCSSVLPSDSAAASPSFRLRGAL